MPALIENSPVIPEDLLQAQEEGKVVFFCGAGISVPAGLPNFEGLVDKIYKNLNEQRSPEEDHAFKNKQYDTVINLLERRLSNGRSKVRGEVANILNPCHAPDLTDTVHRALLTLAMDSENSTRLVTTNFDRTFQHVIAGDSKSIPVFSAPLVPVPKPHRWNGIVHLHGLLPQSSDEASLNNLVLSSGDFGLAYLSEGWAARFVCELLRNYNVCFVGYGATDPVVRYILDAIAADSDMGFYRKKAYAFAGYKADECKEISQDWIFKGVEPLTYEATPGPSGHAKLTDTLNEWAKIYQDGTRGRQMIIAQHASSPPPTSSRLNYSVGLVLWALTNDLAAKHFSEMNPVPPLEWLQPLSERQFGYGDLTRFGVVPNEKDSNRVLNFRQC